MRDKRDMLRTSPFKSAQFERDRKELSCKYSHVEAGGVFRSPSRDSGEGHGNHG
jgi:hypothetical protein